MWADLTLRRPVSYSCIYSYENYLIVCHCISGQVERSLLQGQVCAVLRLDHVPTAMVFVGPSQLFVAVAAADQDGQSAAILEIKVRVTNNRAVQH